MNGTDSSSKGYSKHTVVAWLEDKPGVLNRVVGLFRRRGFNIESLSVGHSETPGISRLTFVVNGDDRMVDQAVKQLYKLVNVTRVEDLTDHPAVIREMALIRVKVDGQTRSEVMQIVDIYRQQIVDVSMDALVIQAVGAEDRVNSLIELLSNYPILEMVRTGSVAMTRGHAGRNGSSAPLRRAAL
ncbi:MAG: acetolactate synthase small subunit [Caldilineales bacterium]|nr:acetolactate synthase small subunit [Caldilineales bacterium]MCW5859203.1 acetolactate synthase small subunit [Caldilineales bacterium]